MAILLHEFIADDKSHLTALEFNDDGSILASSGFDTTIKLWETGGFSEVSRITGHENCANAILFDTGGDRIISASSDATVRFWKASTGECVNSFKPHSRPIVGLKQVPGGELLATSSYDGTIRFLDYESGNEAGRVRGKGREVGHILFLDSGKILATGGISPDITFWSIPEGELLERIPAHNGGTAALMLQATRESMLSIGFDGEVKRWTTEGDATQWKDEQICKIQKKGYFFSCLSPDEKTAAVSVVRGILLIDTASGEVVDEIKVSPKSLYSPRFHPAGKVLVAGAADRKIRVWKIAD